MDLEDGDDVVLVLLLVVANKGPMHAAAELERIGVLEFR